MKVVINDCHGGFGLSDDAFKMFLDRKGVEYRTVEMERGAFGNNKLMFYLAGSPESNDSAIYDRDITRHDPDLVKIVEELGENAGSWSSKLKIIEIPDDIEWQIEEYDGLEWVAEKHRIWK